MRTTSGSIWIGGILALSLSAGCSQAPPIISLNVEGVSATDDVTMLSRVLSASISPQGEVRMGELAKAAPDLLGQLRLFAVTGPDATPGAYASTSSEVAYWYNARMSWSLELARRLGRDHHVELALLRRTEFPLDGRRMSLELIDERLVELSWQEKDFRIAACAPGAAIDDAPLPNKPFTAADMAGRLEETLNQFVQNEKRFVIDIDAKSVYLPPMLWRVRDLLREQYMRQYVPAAPAQCPISSSAPASAFGELLTLRYFVSGMAWDRLEDAMGYRVVEQPPRPALAVEGRMMYLPGRIGKVEVQ